MMSLLFEKYVEDYARYRPGYPDRMVESFCRQLSITDSSIVLDLACGTGNLGRSIRKRFKARIFGIDRSLLLLKHNKYMHTVNGRSEKLPFKDTRFDAVMVGQAFHWFDFDKALMEIYRILKPTGGLAIAWYRRARPLADHAVEMDKLVRKYNPRYNPEFMDYNWRTILTEYGGFGDMYYYTIHEKIEYSIDTYLKFQRTKSYIGDSMSVNVLSKWLKEANGVLHGIYPGGIISEDMEYFYLSAIKQN